MALPAKRVPESVAHLDVEIVAAALIATTPISAMRRSLSAFHPAICASWCWSINAWRTLRSKPSS